MTNPAELSSKRPLFSGVLIARAAVAFVLLGAAAIHFILAPSHFDEDVLYGWFFIVMGIGQMAGAVALLVKRARWVFVSVALGNLVIVLVWLVTRTIGIPVGAETGSIEPVGIPDVVATTLELLAVAGVVFLIVAAPRIHLGQIHRALGSAIVVGCAGLVLGAVVFAAASSREACSHFDPRYGPLAAVDGHSILPRSAKQDSLTTGEIGLVKAGLLVNCGNKPLTVKTVQVVSSAGEGATVESFVILHEHQGEGAPAGHHPRASLVEPTDEHPEFAVFARIRTVEEGVFYLNGLRVIFVYKGRTMSQIFATNVSVQVRAIKAGG